MTKDIGVHGNLFGGIMMAWLDESGAIFASRSMDTTSIVTFKVDEILFQQPVKESDIVLISGEVLEVGNTSIKILLEAKRHNVESGAQVLVCSTKMTFVKIDKHGHSTPLSDKVKERFKDKLRP